METVHGLFNRKTILSNGIYMGFEIRPDFLHRTVIHIIDYSRKNIINGKVGVKLVNIPICSMVTLL